MKIILTKEQLDKIILSNKNEENNQQQINMNEDCWKGYSKKGYKIKNGKSVPNCVKI